VTRFSNDLQGVPNPGPEYKMEGYAYEEVGPEPFEGKGGEQMDKEITEIIARGKLLRETRSSGGCPMAFN
jgi:hypothetical protein